MSFDFPDRQKWLEYRNRPHGLYTKGARPRAKIVSGKLVAVPIGDGRNARKRQIPAKRKARVRLRAHLRGDLRGRPLTAHERSWL